MEIWKILKVIKYFIECDFIQYQFEKKKNPDISQNVGPRDYKIIMKNSRLTEGPYHCI